MQKVMVRCSYEIEVEVPADWSEDMILFHIEENSCPATGYVGFAVERVMEKHEEVSTCWCCACGGKNEVIREDRT